MSNWQQTKIGDVCQSISETYHGNDAYVVLVNTSDVLEGKILNHELIKNEKLKGQFKKTFKKDDILYSEIRPANKRFAYVDINNTSNYIASTKLMVLRPNKEKILPKFLFNILKSEDIISELQHLAETRSGTFPQITFSSELAPMEVLLPPLDIQKKISAVISVLEDKIELNNKINNNLEQQAQALFKSWFIDFEPFGGVMPEDWKIGNLSDIADYLNGLAMQKFRPTENERGLPVLKIKELRQGFCDNSSELCSPNVKREYVVDDGDVIFSWSGSLLVDFWCGGKCGLNQHLFKVTSEKFEKWFYYSWTKHYLNKFVAVAADKATTMGHIKRDELEKAEVVIPSSIDYQKIGKVLSPIYDLIIQNRIENTRLAAIRDALLPKLMSGEIDVSNVDISALTSTDKLSFTGE